MIVRARIFDDTKTTPLLKSWTFEYEDRQAVINFAKQAEKALRKGHRVETSRIRSDFKGGK